MVRNWIVAKVAWKYVICSLVLVLKALRFLVAVA